MVIFPLVSGLSAGLSLIVAIGAQNAFVLRQGIQRSHVAMVVAVCAVSDLLLILLGVAGIGVLLDRAPPGLRSAGNRWTTPETSRPAAGRPCWPPVWPSPG